MCDSNCIPIYLHKQQVMADDGSGADIIIPVTLLTGKHASALLKWGIQRHDGAKADPSKVK